MYILPNCVKMAAVSIIKIVPSDSARFFSCRIHYDLRLKTSCFYVIHKITYFCQIYQLQHLILNSIYIYIYIRYIKFGAMPFELEMQFTQFKK